MCVFVRVLGVCEGVVCWVCVRVWCVGCVCACVGCVCAPVRLAVGQNAILGLIASYLLIPMERERVLYTRA